MMRKQSLLTLVALAVSVFGAHAQRSYTVGQLVDSALTSNIATRAAQHDIEMARQQRKEAFTHYFPTVSAMGGWFNADKATARMDIDPSTLLPDELMPTLAQTLPPEVLAALANPVSLTMMKNGAIGAVAALQPLFAGGQIVNGNRLARVGEEVSRLKLRLAENEVALTTEQYFWQLVALQEKLKTVDAALQLLSSLNSDATAAVAAGVAMRNDLLQVQLRQNEVESDRLKLNNGISLLKLLLAQYCGLADTAFVCAAAGDVALLPVARDHQASLPTTPEYQLLQKNVQASDLQHKMELGKHLPSVAVGVGYNYHNLLERDRTFGMVMATVQVPISDWWGGAHAVRRKKIERIKAEEQLDDNAQLLTIRMQKAWNDLQEAYDQLEIARRSIAQADENLRLHRDFYRAGTVNMSDMLEAQMLYQQACDRRVEAYSDYQVKCVIYAQAVGQTQ